MCFLIVCAGKDALNKLLGRQVYTSNDQLGGVQVMYPNGVSHLVCNTDDDAAYQIMQWLSFVPKARGLPLPIHPVANDSVDRKVTYSPPADGTAYDCRNLLTGTADTTGLFDRDSFIETLGGWARGVVTGRGRIGGVPMGAIIVETRVTEKVNPADVASPESSEQVLPQAGQVRLPLSIFMLFLFSHTCYFPISLSPPGVVPR